MPHKNRGNRKRRQGKKYKQQTKINSRPKQQTKVNRGPETHKRVFKLLQLYDKWNIRGDKDNIYALVCKYYKSVDINLFLKDYGYIINNIDTHKKYLNYYNKCDESKCVIFKRNYRSTSELSEDNRRRTLLYNGINDEIQISIMQHIDIIHNIFYHLIHSGLRYYNLNNKHTLKIRKQNILNKRSQIVINNNNKFVTHCEEIKENDKYMKYSQGFRYYYHERYKNINEQREKIPGTDIIDPGNEGYVISDYYILRKYSDLKTEILSNKNFNFSMGQWSNLNTKAKWRHNTYKNTIRRADDTWQKVYGYHNKTIIGLKCILCLLLYTNYDFIATKLTQTYRKLTPSENYKSLRNRHSYFAHLGQGLKETIEVFGIPLWKSKHKEFYHGINNKMVFDKLTGNFCSPTSTTIIKDVAINFGGDGIILTIRNTKLSNYFNCIPFSDFPGEAEMLFIGALYPLQIIGLSDLFLCKNYNEYIYTMKILQYCLEGMPSLDILSEERYDILLNLLSTKLLLSKLNNSNSLIMPLYIQKIFDHMLTSFNYITIDIGLFKKELVFTIPQFGPQYGYIKLFSLFMDENNYIHFNALYKLVPQIKQIEIRCVKWSSSGDGKYKSSITITDEILLNICSVLHDWPLKGGIFIRSPRNSLSSLDVLAKKYSQMFLPLGYNLKVAKSHSLLCGSCNSFDIY